MQQWEYNVQKVGLSQLSWTETFTKKGEDGWELIQVIKIALARGSSDEDKYSLIYKRPIEEVSDDDLEDEL